MFKKQKKISIFLLLIFLLFSGFGCKGLSKQEVAATQPVTLEYWTVYDDVDAIQKLVQKYRANRPYLTVNIKQLGYDELYTRLVEALAEDKGPDIISVQASSMKKFLSKISPMPVTTQDTIVTQEKNIANQIETVVTVNTKAMPTASQMDRAYMQTVVKDAIYDGKIYGLPLSLDTMAIYYNKDLLDRAGVAELPKDWQEFQEAVRKISKFNQETGVIVQSGAALGLYENIDAAEDILYVLFRQSGIKFTSDSGQAIFNVRPSDIKSSELTPAMTVMNFYTDFANPNKDTYSWNSGMENSLDAFVSGKTAFFFGYSYHNPQIKSRAPQLNYSIMPMLQLNSEQPANIANYWLQTVVDKSKNRNEAWNFINYLANSDATKEYLTETKRPTALRSLVTEQKENLDLQPFVEQILIADNWYRGNDFSVASRALGDLIEEWLDAQIQYKGDIDKRGEEQKIINRAASRINQTF